MTAHPPELRYFHLPQGKKYPPLVKRFYELAVAADQFEPGDHNIGVSTTGLLVVDVDERRGGADTLDTLEMAYGPLPVTRKVRTPNGWHIYLSADTPIANSHDRLGKGIDVRGYHGYVVGAGSVVDDVEYVLEVDAPIAPAPDWLIELCGKPPEREQQDQPNGEDLDSPQAIARATEYLRTAEPAIQGAGGDGRTFATIAAALDFGISKETAADLLHAHWNERCSPPWQPDELERKVDNAWQYRGSAVGSVDAKQEFDVWCAPPTGLEPVAAQDFAEQLDPPRQWVLGKMAVRGKLSLLIAPPGAGKSTLTLAAALSVAAGKDLLDMTVHEQTAAWLYNNEDDMPELRRRLRAAMQWHRIDYAAIKDRLYLNSGENKPFVIARRAGQGDTRRLKRAAEMQEIEQHIKDRGIGLLIVDPFSETHEGDENDNVEMRLVASWFREIAQKTNCAVILVHHTRKMPAGSSEGHVGNMDSGRGASSVNGVARVVQTLYSMSEKDAKRHKIPLSEQHRYVRLDDAKTTLSLGVGRAAWLRRETVDVPTTVEGVTEAVGVLAPVKLVEEIAELTPFDRLVLGACKGVGTPQAVVVERLKGAEMLSGKSENGIRGMIARGAKAGTAYRIEHGPSRPNGPLGSNGLIGAPGSVMIVPVQVDFNDIDVFSDTEIGTEKAS